MSEAPNEAGEKAAARKVGKSEKPEMAYEPLSYGTHTLPKKFWTAEFGILITESFRQRKAAKRARLDDNRARRAEENRRGRR